MVCRGRDSGSERVESKSGVFRAVAPLLTDLRQFLSLRFFGLDLDDKLLLVGVVARDFFRKFFGRDFDDKLLLVGVFARDLFRRFFFNLERPL